MPPKIKLSDLTRILDQQQGNIDLVQNATNVGPGGKEDMINAVVTGGNTQSYGTPIQSHTSPNLARMQAVQRLQGGQQAQQGYAERAMGTGDRTIYGKGYKTMQDIFSPTRTLDEGKVVSAAGASDIASQALANLPPDLFGGGSPRITDIKTGPGGDTIDIDVDPPVGVDLEKDYNEATWKKYAESDIAMSTFEPKMLFYMDVGGRGMREWKNEAAKFGVDLDFEKAGINAWKNILLKKGMDIGKYLPILNAAQKLRPELGFEIMRQIGPFRSSHAAMVFTETLPEFSGYVPEDIATAVTTQTKSFLGALGREQLAKEVFGKTLTRSEQIKKGRAYEANLIRAYNKAYRHMGVSTQFYGVGYDLDEIVKYSKFTPKEEKIISNFQKQNPDKSRDDIIKTAILQGIL